MTKPSNYKKSSKNVENFNNSYNPITNSYNNSKPVRNIQPIPIKPKYKKTSNVHTSKVHDEKPSTRVENLKKKSKLIVKLLPTQEQKNYNLHGLPTLHELPTLHGLPILQEVPLNQSLEDDNYYIYLFGGIFVLIIVLIAMKKKLNHF